MMQYKYGSIIRKTVLFILIAFVVLLVPSCTDMSNRNPIVTFVLDETKSAGIGGTFKMELFPDKAPNSVNYFLMLIEEGYYNDFNVSKVMNGHMVVFGDPWYEKANDRVIKGEFAENGFTGNDVKFQRGTVGLCLFEGDNDSNYGDFFILLDDAGGESMDGRYCAIGQITEGLEILDEISTIKTASAIGYQPMFSVSTLTVTVDLRGKVYGLPETSERSNSTKPGYWTE